MAKKKHKESPASNPNPKNQGIQGNNDQTAAKTPPIRAAAPEKETQPARDLQKFAAGRPVETVKSNEPHPFQPRAESKATDPLPSVQPAPPTKAEAIKALNAEVNAIAAGRPLESVVYRFNKRNGAQTGSSLKYYLACKLNEIENPEQPCDFISPAGPPMESLSGAGKSAAQALQAKKKCPNCPT